MVVGVPVKIPVILCLLNWLLGGEYAPTILLI